MQELAEYSAWGSSSKPTLNQKRSPFLRDAVIVYWWSKSGDNPRREKQTKKTHEVQFKASKHWGKKIKSTFHSGVGLFPDSPSWWKERDQELCLYCLHFITVWTKSLHIYYRQLRCRYSKSVNQQRRSEAFTHQMGLILCPNPRHWFSIRPVDWATGLKRSRILSHFRFRWSSTNFKRSWNCCINALKSMALYFNQTWVFTIFPKINAKQGAALMKPQVGRGRCTLTV